MQDVYRIGTLLELVRELAFTFADDGKRVRVRHVKTSPLRLCHEQFNAVNFTYMSLCGEMPSW